MELELILTELQPFKLSHLRQLFCIVGYRVCCNKFILQFSVDHFETMHTCCGYTEDVHVNVLQNYDIFD